MGVEGETPARGVDAAGGRRWAVVLAAGEGRRLQSLTVDAAGIPVPKQFCSLRGERSLLRLAIDRAAGVVPRERIVPIVAAEHRRWWRPQLAGLPAANIVVQPRNRGTAAGILLPLRHVLRRDPGAVVAFLPSDHHVADEPTLCRTLDEAFDRAATSSSVILLGMAPRGPEPDLGWIVPGRGLGDDGALRPVERFREKPTAAETATLVAAGALANSFLFVARAAVLLELFERQLPHLVELLPLARGGRDLRATYERLPCHDFSRDILEQATPALRVLPVPPCGWSDLGTPLRLAECLARHPAPSGDPARRQPRRGGAPPRGVRLDRALEVLDVRLLDAVRAAATRLGTGYAGAR